MFNVDKYFSAKENEQAKVNLFCFPYAGMGASMYNDSKDYLSSNIEVFPAQLAGHGERMLESPHTEMHSLVKELGFSIRTYLDKPLVFFGHCVGALIAFELIHFIKENYDVEPLHVFFSSCSAPHVHHVSNPIHLLPFDEFMNQAVELSQAKNQTNDLQQAPKISLRGLRADYAIYEKYKYQERQPFDFPITIFSGDKDVIATGDLDAWKKHTNCDFEHKVFSGDHFYVHEHMNAIMQQIESKVLQDLEI